MDASLMVLLLWLGWLAMLWLLKTGLDHVESTLAVDESPSCLAKRPPQAPEFTRPDSSRDIIGRYLGVPIYRDVSIDGVEYRFDRIQPEAATFAPAADERCIAPGLVYIPRR